MDDLSSWLAGLADAWGATGAVVALLTPDGQALEPRWWVGYPDELVESWGRIPVGYPAPLTDALASDAVVIAGPRELQTDYPELTEAPSTGDPLLAAVAIRPRGRDTGALGVLGVTGSGWSSARTAEMVLAAARLALRLEGMSTALPQRPAEPLAVSMVAPAQADGVEVPEALRVVPPADAPEQTAADGRGMSGGVVPVPTPPGDDVPGDRHAGTGSDGEDPRTTATPADGTWWRGPGPVMSTLENQLLQRAFLRLVDDAPVGYAVLDTDLRYVVVNEWLALTNGTSVGEHVGRTIREVVPQLADASEAAFRRVLTSGEPLRDLELSGEVPSEPGRTRHWVESVYPISGAGRTLGVAVLVWEVTERVEAEQERAGLLAAERAATALAERAVDRLELLSRASQRLAVSLEEEDVLRSLADLLVPDYADVLTVLEPDGGGRLVGQPVIHPGAVASDAHAVPPLVTVPISGDSLAARVFRTQQSLAGTTGWSLFDDPVPDDAGSRGLAEALGAVLLTPMIVRRRAVGVLALATHRDRGPGLLDEQQLFSDLADRVAAALKNARLFGQRARIATRLQETLLPATLPDIPGADLAVRYTTADEAVDVGGDLYDVIPLGNRSWLLVIGDVSGRGVDAAGVTGLARHTLRAVAQDLGPAAALSRLNEVVYAQHTDRFLTAVAARLTLPPDDDTAPARLTIARAGHTHPLILRADGSVDVVTADGALLGPLPSVDLEEQTYELAAGDTIVLYTDGITEARGTSDLFGEERLIATLSEVTAPGRQPQRRHHTAADLADRILAAVDRFRATPADDDVALLVLHRRSGAQPVD